MANLLRLQKMWHFCEIFAYLISIVLLVFLIMPNSGCKRNWHIGPDTLPTFTCHCWGPAWSPDGNTIAFGYLPWIKITEDSLVSRIDSSGLALINASGSNKRLLLMAGIAPFLCYPDFNPDERWLVYIGGPGGVNNIYKARINGDSITQLTFNYYWNRNPKWGPDGKKILFGRTECPGDSEGLCLMDADGSNNKMIHQSLGIALGDFLPDYRIVFEGWVGNEPGIWVTDTTGLNKQKISGAGGIDLLSCAPDGSNLLLGSYNEKKLRFEIWVMNIDGTNKRLLCIDGRDPSWSPDGSKIVYVKFNYCKQAMTHPGYGELWLMNADGSNQRQLTFIE